MEEGEGGYPEFFVYDGSKKENVLKTYNNLNRAKTAIFKNQGKEIVVAGGADEIQVEAG